MATEHDINKLAALFAGARRITCLSGAGMSTESGIPDYRSSKGLYNTLTSEQVFDIARFRRKPELFYSVIGPLYLSILKAQPNAGHVALAQLADRFGKELVIATQNIDGLHQKAGSRVVHEVHGTMDTLSCQDCGSQALAKSFLNELGKGEILRHRCGGVFKPDITFFGEQLPAAAFSASLDAMADADLVLVLGTSLQVHPAASLPDARRDGCPLLIVNRTPTAMDDKADMVFHDSIGELLPQVLAQMDHGAQPGSQRGQRSDYHSALFNNNPTHLQRKNDL
ncbi:MAG TPA: NAD-dependent deacylase [Lentisphaeria bacterium]|nr:NAD-dependent deacylase [Lentisphaeria bacterium]